MLLEKLSRHRSSRAYIGFVFGDAHKPVKKLNDFHIGIYQTTGQ
jgi:hypothetical protein